MFGFGAAGRVGLIPAHDGAVAVGLGGGKLALSPVGGSITATRNRANWSGGIPAPGAAVQVMDLTVPAATLRSRRAVHPPGICSALTSVRSGRATVTSVVAAPFSDSLGTEKMSGSRPPPGLVWSAST